MVKTKIFSSSYSLQVTKKSMVLGFASDSSPQSSKQVWRRFESKPFLSFVPLFASLKIGAMKNNQLITEQREGHLLLSIPQTFFSAAFETIHNWSNFMSEYLCAYWKENNILVTPRQARRKQSKSFKCSRFIESILNLLFPCKKSLRGHNEKGKTMPLNLT